MQHCTPEQLSLAALREPLPDADAAHLDTCARCREELASLRRGVDALAVPELAAPGAAVPPPPQVWVAIAAATGVTAAGREAEDERGRDRGRRPGAPSRHVSLPFRWGCEPILAGQSCQASAVTASTSRGSVTRP